MRSSLSKVSRSALVFTAATLVALTAACGPGDLTVLGAGAAAPVATAAGTPSEAAVRVPAEASVAPVEEIPAPAPVPPVETAVEEPVDVPVDEPVAEEATEPAEQALASTEQVRHRTSESAHHRQHQRQRPSAGGSGDRSSAGKPSTGSGRPSTGSGMPSAPAAPAPAPGTGAGSAAGPASGGSGGSYTDQQRTRFTAANGQSGQYLRYAAGVDPSREVGLVVYADGTGEYGVDNPSSSYALGGSSGLVAVAKARNMITLAVESPNQSCECWHTGDTSAYADFLADLIEHHYGSYPIGEVWLVGFSSGAQEITRFLVPRHPELMRVGGGWVVFGGGGPPAGSASGVTTASMAGVRGYWYTGTADTAVPLTASWGARAGESWYGARGVVASSEYPSGVGHGLDGKLGSTLGRMIDAG